MPSQLSKAEMVALIIGAVGGLVALPKTAYEAWQTISSSPNVTITASTPLKLTYEPRHRVISFVFGIIVQNEGNKHENLRDANAFFGIPNDVTRRQQFNITQITLKEGENQIPINLPITKESFKTFTCEITAPMTNDLITLLTQHESRRELELTLSGQGGQPYSVKFQFDIGRDLASALLDPKVTSIRTFQFIGSNLQ